MMVLRCLQHQQAGGLWLREGSEGWALTVCLWSPQNMFGMWKPMVFLALAAVALYVLPNMRQQETEFCLLE